MTETIFGKKIIDSYRLEEALKNKSGLVEVASDNQLEELDNWADHMRQRDIPFIIIHRVRHIRKFALLKQGYVVNNLGEEVPKNCACNPLTKQSCPKCKPWAVNNRTRKNMSKKRSKIGDGDENKKTDKKQRPNGLQLLARGKGRLKTHQSRATSAC